MAAAGCTQQPDSCRDRSCGPQPPCTQLNGKGCMFCWLPRCQQTPRCVRCCRPASHWTRLTAASLKTSVRLRSWGSPRSSAPCSAVSLPPFRLGAQQCSARVWRVAMQCTACAGRPQHARTIGFPACSHQMTAHAGCSTTLQLHFRAHLEGSGLLLQGAEINCQLQGS